MQISKKTRLIPNTCIYIQVEEEERITLIILLLLLVMLLKSYGYLAGKGQTGLVVRE